LKGYEKKEAIDYFQYNLAANPNSSNVYEALRKVMKDIGERNWLSKISKKSVRVEP